MASRRLLLLILCFALALRLIFALAQDPLAPYADRNNDAGWYLGNAYALVTGQSPARMITDVSNLASPPLYFLVLGIPQAMLSPAGAVIAVRVLQAILSTATVYFAYRLAVLLTGREGAGLLAAGVLAISPAFIIEASQLLTETLYIFLIAGGVWLYIETILNRQDAKIAKKDESVGAQRAAPLQNPRSMGWLILAALCFGLATLTRAVFLAFPFALAVHLIMVRRWRKGWRLAALFLLVYALVVSTWTVYSVARWNRFVIAGEGLPAFLYIGATGWNGATQVDQSLAQQSPDKNYLQAAESTISGDPVGWVKHRVSELANAYLQPHGTTFFPGASLKEQALDWLHQDRTVGGLIALTQGAGFWPKLALYALHTVGLIAGLIGMWLYRRRWVIALPMISFIIYVTLVHLALLALPRYLFPTEIFWWIFAAAAFQRLLARLTRRRIELTA